MSAGTVGRNTFPLIFPCSCSACLWLRKNVDNPPVTMKPVAQDKTCLNSLQILGYCSLDTSFRTMRTPHCSGISEIICNWCTPLRWNVLFRCKQLLFHSLFHKTLLFLCLIWIPLCQFPCNHHYFYIASTLLPDFQYCLHHITEAHSISPTADSKLIIYVGTAYAPRFSSELPPIPDQANWC